MTEGSVISQGTRDHQVREYMKNEIGMKYARHSELTHNLLCETKPLRNRAHPIMECMYLGPETLTVCSRLRVGDSYPGCPVDRWPLLPAG